MNHVESLKLGFSHVNPKTKDHKGEPLSCGFPGPGEMVVDLRSSEFGDGGGFALFGLWQRMLF